MFFPKAAPDVLVLNAKGTYPAMFLIGHEFGHSLKRGNAELYRQLSDFILKLAPDRAEYSKKLAAKEYTPEQYNDEFVNDFIGREFNSKGFWAALAKEDAGFFRRLSRAAIKFMDGIISQFKGLERDVAPFISDLQAARKELVSVLKDYSIQGDIPDIGWIPYNDTELFSENSTLTGTDAETTTRYGIPGTLSQSPTGEVGAGQQSPQEVQAGQGDLRERPADTDSPAARYAGTRAAEAFQAISYEPARRWGIDRLAEGILSIREKHNRQWSFGPPLYREDYNAHRVQFVRAVAIAKRTYRDLLATVDAKYADKPGQANFMLARTPEAMALFERPDGTNALEVDAFDVDAAPYLFARKANDGGGNFEQQLNAVRSRYEGTPMWMRAPNGETTKLTERQWLTVRTPNFKMWFGDWETLAAERAFENAVDSILAGTWDITRPVPVGATPEVLLKSGADPLPITMAPTMVKKVTEQSHDLPTDIVRQVSKAIKDPVFVFESASVPDSLTVILDLKHRGQNVLVAVHLNKREGRHEVNRIASIYDKTNPRAVEGWIKTGLLRYSHQAKSRAWFRSRGLQLPKEGSIRGNSKLLSEADVVNRNVNPENVSKVVDKNGEPMVMYHGTGAEFEIFDADPKKRVHGHPSKVMGMFFTNRKSVASRYAQGAKGTRVVSAFLKITTPQSFDLEEFYQKYDGYKNADWKQKEREAKKDAQSLKDSGKDGIIVDGGYEAITFTPTQIKSATDNNGEFSLENPSILRSRKATNTQTPDLFAWAEENRGPVSAYKEALESEGITEPQVQAQAAQEDLGLPAQQAVDLFGEPAEANPISGQQGTKFKPRNIVEGFMSPNFTYDILNDTPVPQGRKLIASKLYERKIRGHHHLWRLNVIENEDGTRYAMVENGIDERANSNAAETRMATVEESTLESPSLEPVAIAAENLWKEHLAPKPPAEPAQTKAETPTPGKIEDAAIATESEIADFLNGDPVASIEGNQFANAGENMVDAVLDFWRNRGITSASHPVFGEVALNKAGVKDSWRHGRTAEKAATFAHLHEIIPRSRIIDTQSNYKGGTTDRVILAAPISVDKTPSLAAIILLRDSNTSRFYLHDVWTKSEMQDSPNDGTENQRPGTNPASLKNLFRKVISVNQERQDQGLC